MSVFDSDEWPWRPFYEEAGYCARRDGSDRKLIRALGQRLINLCRTGFVDEAVAMIKREKRKKGVFDVHNSLGRTALMYACTIHGMHETVALLLRYGADPTRWCNGGFTALHFAAAANNAAAVDILSAWPHLLNQRDCAGSTPLMVACLRRKCKSAERLVMLGCDVSIPDANGDTPLHIACRFDSMISVSKLIANMSPTLLQAKNNRRETPLQIAIASRAKKTIDMINARSAPFARPYIDLIEMQTC
jgi:ankyrin repeat protein